jgi:predicted nucleic-acid-binding protein
MNRVDANVVLRYLLDDHEQISEKAADIIDNEQIFLSLEVICEIVYVLMGVYSTPRTEIAETKKDFLQGENIATNDPAVTATALDIFAHNNIDFVDAILCAYYKHYGDIIITFDKKLESLAKEQHLIT